ncbi:MAG: VOC family protein [Phycisphaerales bacterium]
MHARTNQIAHFAIHADDVERAKAFYAEVFGWAFEPWGPPEFYLIDTGEGGLRGALQRRRQPVSGAGMTGYECTIAVDDVDAAIGHIERAGGTITSPPFKIPSVGTVATFTDTEGNTACVMRYD